MMKLGMMMLFVTDLGEAKKFYCDILEFKLKTQGENWLEFEHSRCPFIAFSCEKGASTEGYSRIARSVFVFEVGSIDQSVNQLRSKGVNFLHSEPAENQFGRYAAFSDPFGNIHEIYERKIDQGL